MRELPVVATFSIVGRDPAWANTGFGPDGLKSLRQGLSAQAVLDRLIADDPRASHRQVGVVDMHGSAASYTGPDCLPWAGGRTSPHRATSSSMKEPWRQWPRPIQELKRLLGLWRLYMQKAESLLKLAGALELEVSDHLRRLGYLAPDVAFADAWRRFVGTENLEERDVREGFIDPVILEWLRRAVSSHKSHV